MPSLSALFVALALLVGCGGSPGLNLRLVDSSHQKPSNVAVYFAVDTRDGEPVPGLKVDAFRIYEDGRLVSVHESKQTILNPTIAAAHYTLLLVDMSGSVTESDDVPTIVAAARAFALRVGKLQKVAVFAFDGSKRISRIVDFSANVNQLENGIERLDGFVSRDPSTNLNGAIVESLGLLDRELARSNMPLRFGTLVVFTDGTDRAARVSREDLFDALDNSEHEIFVIGVGSEIDESDLRRIGRSATILSQRREDITDTFEQVASRIEAFTRRYYLLGYCSPARAGAHEVTIEAEADGKRGSLTYEFNADGFRPRCDPTQKPRFDLRRPSIQESDED